MVCCPSQLVGMEEFNRECCRIKSPHSRAKIDIYLLSYLWSKNKGTKGEEHNLIVKSYPEYFQIRFTEFLYELINSHLASWNATVLYFKKDSADREACDCLKDMTDEVKIRLTCFFGDVLSIFKRYQKIIQSDSVTLLDLEKQTSSVKAQLQLLLEKHLVGGWENALAFGLSEIQASGLSLKGAVLSRQRPRRVDNLFVTPQRDLAAIKNEVVLNLEEFLDQRFAIDDEILKVLKPFVELHSDADTKNVHQTICADLDFLDSLMTLQELNNLKELSLSQLLLYNNDAILQNKVTRTRKI